jgi:SAM-dependent methyltransferase
LRGNFRTHLKWRLFPGVNLHARHRYRLLPAHFGAPPAGKTRWVLDAGCGNGMLAFKSHLLGNRVIGITFKENEVAGCRRLFNEHLAIPEGLLTFRLGNLYELDFPDESFDEIICSEVLEHLRGDDAVCRRFSRLLKPGGCLHVCAPNAEHPYNAAFPLDPDESGGHVRPGYSLALYRLLLEPIGFEIDRVQGLGGPVRQAFNRRIKELQARFGAAAGVPLFLLSLPCLPFENRAKERYMPFSIYVRAVKRP